MEPIKPVQTDATSWWWRMASIMVGAGACVGCYNGETLVKQARSVVLSTRLAEIDLGAYHTTLPRDPQSHLFTELHVHLFATVPRYRVAEIEAQLKSQDFRLRHEMLVALRRSTRDELAEPNLTKLRERIQNMVNRILDKAPVSSIGFFSFKLREM